MAGMAGTDRYIWKNDFYLWLPLTLVSWWLAWKYQDRFISDWDGFDYTSYTVKGLPSALGLGRALFLGYNRLLWVVAQRGFGVPAEQAYLVIRYAVIALSGPTIVGIYALGKELTASRLASFICALLVVASPFYIIYSGRTMSEIPGFFMLGWSLWWMLRSLRRGRAVSFLIAAYLIGLSANIREFAVFFLPFIPIAAHLYRRNWKLGAGAFGLAVFGMFNGIMFWTVYAPECYWPAAISWYRLSAHEREIYPITFRNFLFFGDFAFQCSAATAIVIPLAFLLLWPRKKLRPLLFFGLFGLLADLALLTNHDLPVNPRYLMTGLIGVAAVCGWGLAELIKIHGLRAAPLLIGLVVLTKGSYNHTARDLYNQEWSARASINYMTRIEGLPWNSAFIIGSRTPLVNFYINIGARPYWKTIPTGSGWPDEKLDLAIDDLFMAGRVVYVDFDPEIWQSGLREKSREAPGLEMIKRRYQLEQIRDHYYRIIRKRPETTDLFAAKIRNR